MTGSFPIHIEAVTVNHNSSPFAELMLRSLFARHGQSLALSMTIMDNDSTDDMSMLRAYAKKRGIPINRSGFGTGPSEINSHGEILRDFVLTHPECSHYLFIDPDVYFFHDNTLDTMLEEVSADQRAFGITARFTADGENEVEMPTGNACTGQEFTMRYSIRISSGEDTGRLAESKAILRPRLHPFCALICNSDIFRSTVQEISLSPVWTFAQARGCYYDTLGLLTAVMRTHGLKPILSSAMVLHFFSVSYDEQWIETKRERCRKLLASLRAKDTSPVVSD